MTAPITLTGTDLTSEQLRSIARDGTEVRIGDDAAERIRAANEVVLDAARTGTPVYGVTTGLGSRVTERVADTQGTEYSLRTIRGRATAVGEPLDIETTRAALVVRLNGVCAGGSGASAAAAELLAGMLNQGVHPVIPRSGSVGAADLCLMAHVGLAMIGEGDAVVSGVRMSAARALSQAGLLALVPGPKDGLAMCSSNAVSAGAAAIALTDGRALLEATQIAAALSMEGFRAALSPLDPRVVQARPQPGQAFAATGLRALLAGGSLTEPDAARRLQDPLSFRCASQVHGSLHVALDLLAATVEPELNGAADNPLVLAGDHEILSTGNFQVPALAMALDTVAIAVAQVASVIAERQTRLKAPRLSGLPRGLIEQVDDAPTQAGLMVLTRTAESLRLEIRHLAAPFAIHAGVSADGVEDDSTGAAQAALRVLEQLAKLRLLVASELLTAAQATELAAPERLGAGTAEALRCVREVVAPVTEDRALGPDVERLAAEVLADERLNRRVGDAVAKAAEMRP
jgi:histidine ammonia-lyase